MNKCVIAKTQKEFIHCWPDAFDEVKYLRNPHRHMLHLEVVAEVTHSDREIEIITLKKDVERLFDEAHFALECSCEMVGEYLLKQLQYIYGTDRYYQIEVMEDGENGALLTVDRGEVL